jgi:N-acyl homoserine lactone hydrolase
MEIIRLHLGSVTVSGLEWPVHGFVVVHPKAGAILVDTGVGGPDSMLREWRAINTSAADALAKHDMSPADVRMVVNTHLHFDHCGWNAVFPHAPFWVQRAEVERARRESPELADWWDFAGARFELLDGGAVIADGIRVVATPGHTRGHQSVLVDLPGGLEVLIGDAAYTQRIWSKPDSSRLPDGQAADRTSWRRSLGVIGDLKPRRIHFCHDETLDAVQTG